MRLITFASIILLIPLNAMAFDETTKIMLGNMIAVDMCEKLKNHPSGLYETETSSDAYKFMMKSVKDAMQDTEFSENLDKVVAELEDVPDAFRCIMGLSFLSGVNFRQIALERMPAN